MKKKIAIFQEGLDIGGIEKSLINLLKNLDFKKYEVDLYLFKKGRFLDQVPTSVNVIFLKKRFGKLETCISFQILFKMLKFNYAKKEYDIAIDFNGYSKSCSVACLKTNSKKKILWIHNDLDKKYHNELKYRIIYLFSKRKFSLFDKFVFVSEGAKEGFFKLYGKCPYEVIPNYINTEEIFSLSEENVDFKVERDKYNFVFLGRLCYQKGIDLLLPKIKNLLNERRDFKFYIIGDGKMRSSLEKQVLSLGISNYVTFLGAIKNPYPYLKKMDAFLFNSRYEGQGMVLLEAKCLGLEIIMPKYLEKYCELVSGVDNMEIKMASVKKKKKDYDALDTYNFKIKERIEKLLEE